MVLLHDDLNRIAWSFELARRVKRIMLANLVFATCVIALLAALTLIGILPLPIGVIGHEGLESIRKPRLAEDELLHEPED